MAPSSRGNRRDLPPPGTTTLDPLIKDPYLIGRFRFNPKWAQKPWSDVYFKWLIIISCAVWYNLIFIIARAVFCEFQDGPQVYAFAALDYICDTLYLLDMLIKLVTGYLENGILIREPRKLARKYYKSSTFVKDVLSLIPTDLLFIYTGWQAPWPILRINRLLRLGRVGDFYYRAQTRLDSPNTFRLIYLILTMIMVVHLNACVYYFVSSLVGIGLDRWAYPGRAGWRYLEGHHGSGHGSSGHGGAGNHTELDFSHSIVAGDGNGTFGIIATHGGGDRVNGTEGLVSRNGTEIFASGDSLEKIDSHKSTLVDMSNSHSPRGHHNSPDEADLQDNAGGSEKAKISRRTRREIGGNIRRINRQHEDPSRLISTPSTLVSAVISSSYPAGGFIYQNGSFSPFGTAGNHSYQSSSLHQPPRTRTSGHDVTSQRHLVSDNDDVDRSGRTDSNDIAMTDAEESSNHSVSAGHEHTTDRESLHNVDSHNNSDHDSHNDAHGSSADKIHGGSEHNSTNHEDSHGSYRSTSGHENATDHSENADAHGHSSASGHVASDAQGALHESSGHDEHSEHSSGGGHGNASDHSESADAHGHSSTSGHGASDAHESSHELSGHGEHSEHSSGGGHGNASDHSESADAHGHSSTSGHGASDAHESSHELSGHGEHSEHSSGGGHGNASDHSESADAHGHSSTSGHGASDAHESSHVSSGHGQHSEHGSGDRHGGHGEGGHGAGGHGEGGHGEGGHGEGGHGEGGHGEGGEHEAAAGGHHKPIKISPEFVNDTLYKKYSYCMYWSVKMMTSKPFEIANPSTTIQFVFHLADAFLGILMFATIVGEVDGIIESINKKSDDFKEHLDSVRQYISMRRVGKEMEARVVKWFDYIWANNGSLDEESVLTILPEKLRMEIAKHVHLEVLKKVPIFQGIEEQFLLELAEKLKPQAFCPGDFVCRRGDIGREIFVVRRGLLNVIAADGEKVIVTLKSGVVFGELSLLNVPGSVNGNRRTVTVKSVGYADLFSLSKEDFDACLAEYPEVKDLLMEKARKILQKDNLINEDVAREQARRQRNFEVVAEKLEESLEIVTTRLEMFVRDNVQMNRKLEERLRDLTASYNGIVAPKIVSKGPDPDIET